MIKLNSFFLANKKFIPNYILLFITEIVSGFLIPMVTILFFKESNLLFENYTSIEIATTYTIIIGISQILHIFSSSIFGYISDKFSYRRAVIICYILYMLKLVLIPIAIITSSLSLFFISFVFGSLIISIQPLVTSKILIDAKDKHKLVLTAIVQFFIGLGYTIGPMMTPVILYLFKNNTYPNVIIPYVISFFIVLFLCIWIMFSRLFSNNIIKNKINIKDYKYFKNKKIMMLFCILFFDQLTWGILFKFIAPLGTLILEFKESDISFFYAMIGISSIFYTLFLIPLFNKFLNLYYILKIGSILMFFGSILIFVSFEIYSINLLWFGEFIILSGNGIVFISLSVLISKNLPKRMQAISMGMIYAVGGTVWALSIFIGGYFFVYFKEYILLVPLISTVIIFSLILFWRKEIGLM